MNPTFWRGKRVFVTGHTGFKGGWLTLWLSELGAQVYGFSLAPPTFPSFFEVCGLKRRLAAHILGDIREADTLAAAMRNSGAEIVLHLAAQPLVRRSYVAPVETFASNVMGTVNLLEAVRKTPTVRAVVNVTSDKCYDNQEWLWPYREGDQLGGSDPYSSSKACAELVTEAYRRSFLVQTGVQLASARAGNVMGGGDWADDRLLPDFLRALDEGRELRVRHPEAIRPWQHVLESLSGYLLLAEQLYEKGAPFTGAWNFGPSEADAYSVRWIVEHLCAAVPDARWAWEPEPGGHEASILKLDSTRARAVLGWRSRWSVAIALDRTLEWHGAWRRGEEMAGLSVAQIRAYQEYLA